MAGAPEPSAKAWLSAYLLRRDAALSRRIAHYYKALLRRPRRWRRALRRRLALTVAGAALLLALTQATVPALPMSIAVDDSAVIVAEDGFCSLGEAIINANDTIDGLVHGDCNAGDPTGADTIVLPPDGAFYMSSTQSAADGDYNALPLVTSEIIIQGNNSTFLRNPDGPAFRFIGVDNYANLTVDAITFEGGLSLNNAGGAIFSVGSSLIVNNSVFRHNEGSAIKVDGDLIVITGSVFENNEGFNGGAIYNQSSKLTLTDSVITGNVAVGNGGGIASEVGMVVIENTIFQNNVAEQGGALSFESTSEARVENSRLLNNEADVIGGAIRSVYESDLVVRRSTFSGNHANSGGAVHNNNSTLVVEQSTMSGNSAGWGGGVTDTHGSTTIKNSTLSGNFAGQEGGGIYIVQGVVVLTNNTITGNTAYAVNGFGGGISFHSDPQYGQGSLAVEQTIVSGNSASHRAQINSFPLDFVTVDGFNVFGADGDAGIGNITPGPSDIVPPAGVTPLDILNPLLADNGGPTWTHALRPGSPAIDAAPSAPCAGQTDQRGFSRNLNGDGQPSANECDIGAFERGPIVTNWAFLPFAGR
jgi:hypothetical protein